VLHFVFLDRSGGSNPNGSPDLLEPNSVPLTQRRAKKVHYFQISSFRLSQCFKSPNPLAALGYS